MVKDILMCMNELNLIHKLGKDKKEYKIELYYQHKAKVDQDRQLHIFWSLDLPMNLQSIFQHKILKYYQHIH